MGMGVTVDGSKVGEGDAVHVQSRHGSFTLHAQLTEQVRPGEPFATFQAVEAYVNRATGSGRDGTTGTPEYKVTAVALRKA